MDSHPGLPFEFPADVVFTDVKFLFQSVQGDFFVQMMLDENENIIERKAGAHFCVCLEFVRMQARRTSTISIVRMLSSKSRWPKSVCS
ncbi:MAG: hypothetical protein ACLSIF_08220 [Faecalimonas umbilicata]